MEKGTQSPIILIAEDDDDQYELTSSALSDYRAKNRLRRVVDGEELFDYLRQEGDYSNSSLCPRPDLILLDLNMPKKDGRAALKEIKSSEKFCHIPIVVLTSRADPSEVRLLYEAGANSVLIKPASFNELIQMLKIVEHYWTVVAQFPVRGSHA